MSGRIELDRTDVEIMRRALLFVRQALAARREPTDAFDRTAANIENALTTAVSGGPQAPPRHTEYVDIATAAKALHYGERYIREIAPNIGGIKIGGRWLIPTDSLPDEEHE